MSDNKMKLITVCLLLAGTCTLQAQVATVTNAFDDLKRRGTVNEQMSEMRQVASPEALEKLLAEKPVAGYFCFTEDRMHDIRLTDSIPRRWAERAPERRNQFKGEALPGEFYTWQIGLFTPRQALKDLSVIFTDMRNEQGKRIDASAFRCFNLGGVDTDGRSFRKKVDVASGAVQALWIGADIPTEASGVYTGKVTVKAANAGPVVIACELTVGGNPVANHGDNEGWRKTRLRWLDSSVGSAEKPTAPYTPVLLQKHSLSWLGGTLELSDNGLPGSLVTFYDQGNRLDPRSITPVLADGMRFVIETATGYETLKPGALRITKQTETSVSWTVKQKNRNFEVTCSGSLGFDGLADYKIQVRSLTEIAVKDIRLEVPYSAYAARYMMGLGHKGGFRPDSLINWHWDVNKHQDKIWMGNVNAGANICFKDENYVRPLVNIYFALGKLNLPLSWANTGKGGVDILPEQAGTVLLKAYSGERHMQKDERLHYNFSLLVTPVKPLNLNSQAQERFYHSNSDLSSDYIPEALKAGANLINVHHKKDIYPFINYPYYDEAVPDLKRFISEAHNDSLGVRPYYTTRELTVKIPELWALRSLGGEIIHDGPGKDTRTLIHRNGPNEWLNRNLGTHFIPAWYNAFGKGKYAGDMDVSVITTPDSRWNNYYLEGLDWMIRNLGIDGIYIDDSALDHRTLQRARRILDADGRRRLVDIHSWNHMNEYAGYANSLQLYLELLPYVDRTWMGEGFGADNTPDFWLVEMSGIPFGLMSETLDARNLFRGMVYGMLPRLPWSGNPQPLWQLWDTFGMGDARMYGYWEERCPVKTDNPALPATVYVNGDKALVVIANWTDLPQHATIGIDEQLLGFTPSSVTLPEIKNLQWGSGMSTLKQCEVMGRSGMIVLLEK